MGALTRLITTGLYILAAAANGTAEAQTKTLRVVPQGDLTILDPVWSTANVTLLHGYMIYDTLFALDTNYQPKPQMVGAHSVSADGKEYRFTLRPGLEWHDGAPVTAADCVASLRRWGARDDEGRLIFSITEELSAEDATTFRWRLKEPYANLLANLGKMASSPAFIMPERVARADATKPIEETIGSGLYVFKRDEWAPGNKVVYLRNPKYQPRDEPSSMFAGRCVARIVWSVGWF